MLYGNCYIDNSYIKLDNVIEFMKNDYKEFQYENLLESDSNDKNIILRFFDKVKKVIDRIIERIRSFIKEYNEQVLNKKAKDMLRRGKLVLADEESNKYQVKPSETVLKGIITEKGLDTNLSSMKKMIDALNKDVIFYNRDFASIMQAFVFSLNDKSMLFDGKISDIELLKYAINYLEIREERIKLVNDCLKGLDHQKRIIDQKIKEDGDGMRIEDLNTANSIISTLQKAFIDQLSAITYNTKCCFGIIKYHISHT